jgi:protein O-GlcNAc transferase
MIQETLQLKINQIIQMHSLGQTYDAINALEVLIETNTSEALLFNISGVLFKEIGDLDKAINAFENALLLDPNYADANYNLGLTFDEINEIDSAINYYEKAILINPKYPDALNNLGNLYKNNSHIELGIECFKKALDLEPNFVAAWNNLGNAYKDLNQLEKAVDCYHKAINIDINIPELHNNLGNVLKNLGQFQEALDCYKKAIAMQPENFESFNNIGIVLDKLGLEDEAVEAYEKAIEINPDFAEGYFNRGQVLKNLTRFPEALASFELAYMLEPDIDYIFGDILHLKMNLCIWDGFSDHLNDLIQKINGNDKIINPFSMLSLIDSPETQRKVSEAFIKKDFDEDLDTSISIYSNHEKIIVGYFSPDFRDHAVAFLTAALFESHNRDKFEIHAFSYGDDTNDEMNLRVKKGVDKFHNINLMSDLDVINLSRSIEVDIAIDLAGYTQNSRTELFAQRLAPIQVNYLGYTGTSGASYMDYIIADSTIIKDSKEYSENIVFMPNSYMVNDILQKKEVNSLTREDVGLPEDKFIFCCFNNHYKILPDVFSCWMRILTAVEESVLWLSDSNDFASNNLIKEAQKNGIDKDRIIFAPQLPSRMDHLSRVQLADLFLDTSPFNAHTTASDALRMGLPLLTCIGKSFVSRVAASLLEAIKLPELIVTNHEEYEALAIYLGKNNQELKIIKNKLKKNLETEALFKTPLYARHIEDSYIQMYKNYQKGLLPSDIVIND